jgi:aminopeptidase N
VEFYKASLSVVWTGLEYDLDLFNIVAVDDFNMGAMENKSLNIFNSRLIIASPATSTDMDFARIEGVVAHEYFHNWTGNRVTCRDWFQLTLKEGLTVFRDQVRRTVLFCPVAQCLYFAARLTRAPVLSQEFSSDMNSRPVKRIEDVSRLRTAQFVEDAGAMAHPIRPDSYIKMDNFYTLTVYEKGAEIVRLYQTLLGKDGFRCVVKGIPQTD